MINVALSMTCPGGPSSYNSHNFTKLNMHSNFGLTHYNLGLTEIITIWGGVLR